MVAELPRERLRQALALAEALGDVAGAEELYRRSLALFTAVGAKPEMEKVAGWLRGLGAAP